ncbi:DUF2309 family protein [bacterium]|nr:DUF2309 family protein [bacterium]
MNAILEPEMSQMSPSLEENVGAACRRIPPLWSLKNFVAVNPFLGLTDRHFVDATTLIQRVSGGEMLMPAQFYLDKIASGHIRQTDFRAAIVSAEDSLPAEWAQRIDVVDLTALERLLKQSASKSVNPLPTFADVVDAHRGTDWAAFVVDEISKWCSAFYDQGQSSWRMPWRHLNLFAAWKAAARLDANPELTGLKHFREFVNALSDNHWKLIEHALDQLGVPDAQKVDFLHRLLMSVPGWSSYVQHLAREQDLARKNDDALAQLLAIRLTFDLALRQQFGKDETIQDGWRKQLAHAVSARGETSDNVLARFIAQQALECGYQRDLITKLKDHRSQPTPPAQKSLQAVFCIDVRSEVFRRALESQSDRIETIGFAGFFGMPIEHFKFGHANGRAQCPALLTPKFRVRETHCDPVAADEPGLLRWMDFRKTINGAWNAFKSSAISCFSFVETAGLWFGVKLTRNSLALVSPDQGFADAGGRQSFRPKIEREVCSSERDGHHGETGIEAVDQVALAAGALKNMGLISDFAKVVLLCGHGSATTNNPYGSALDCGACGGHAGDANARVAAAILNQPAVREALNAQGIDVPTETMFIAGLHNTTTDEILIYEDASLTADQSTELKRIKEWLSSASKLARRERAPSLGLGTVADPDLDQQVLRRSRDWSQVRPEWGLAGNAAFIAAPRERTKGLNLGGRVFLHNYHADLDADKSTLELILSAPMVVASWINLQYYGSTVDNRLFGSGNKVLHNILGTFGVWQGNGGDLRPGLPLQSLHDGTRWVHEPLRLSVFIEAPRENIKEILARQPGVRELVTNGWVHLFAIENSGSEIHRFTGSDFQNQPL